MRHTGILTRMHNHNRDLSDVGIGLFNSFVADGLDVKSAGRRYSAVMLIENDTHDCDCDCGCDCGCGHLEGYI